MAVILLVLFTAQSFYSATIYIWFQLNREAITKAFCFNIARPELKCGGKCYLAKQLQQAEENNPPQQLKEWVDLAPFVLEMDEPVPVAPFRAPMHRSAIQVAYTHQHLSAVFRPPLS